MGALNSRTGWKSTPWVQARTLVGAKCATVQGLQNYRASKFTQYTKFLDDRKLLSSCVNLEVKLKSERSDIDGRELYVELKFIQDHIDISMGPLDILKYLKLHGSFPNAIIAYRILLTIPVTVASAERSFSKLKLLKSYLRCTMTQERLNGLATIALANDILEMIKYEDIIEDFISKNTKRMMLFSRT